MVTGETGAGKTMVVTGLGLLFGGRGDPARVRPGADRATVEGRLRIEPGGHVAQQVDEAGGELDDGGSALVVSRSVSAEGRSRAHAGGRSVPVSLLTYLADELVAVHGQADQQQLLKPGRQRAALDRYAGAKLTAVLADYQRAFHRHREVAAELTELTERARERAQQADDLRAGLAEVERLEAAEGEDEGLLAEEERLAHADALHAAATTAHQALAGDPSACAYEVADAAALLTAAQQALDGASEHDAMLASLAGQVREAAYVIADVATELASYAQSVEADPARLRGGAGAARRSWPGWSAPRQPGRRGREPGRRCSTGPSRPRCGSPSSTATTTGSAAAGRRGADLAAPAVTWPTSSPSRASRPPAGSPTPSPRSSPRWPCRTPG